MDKTDICAYNRVVPAALRVAAFLARLATALASERVRITWKADEELVELGWSHEDALARLALLSAGDLLRTEEARDPGCSTIWVFCPPAWEIDRHLWIRLAESADETFVVSFHPARGDPWN